jgi:PadR family transcriptional regulator, regulatory protein PadR
VRLTIQSLRALKLLVQAPAGLAGADIMRETGTKSGTLYPILSRFEAGGWLTSKWEAIDPQVEGRPRRRIYKLTADGRKRAVAALEERSHWISGDLPLIHTGLTALRQESTGAHSQGAQFSGQEASLVGMTPVDLTRDELSTLLDALALAASRREAQARCVKFGRHHDDEAAKMRRLRFKLMSIRKRQAPDRGRHTP